MQKLSTLNQQIEAKILEIKSGHDLVQHLAGMGLISGVFIKMLQNSGRGPILIEVRGSKIGLGREMASKILVTTDLSDIEDVSDAISNQKLDNLNGKRTKQRKIILEVVEKTTGHFTVEELTKKVKKIDQTIGMTTVYRTLKLFEEQGYIQSQNFDDNLIRYEKKTTHHDHLICEKCGKFIEFQNPKIEFLQDQESKKFDFEIKRHKLEIYGLCKECQKKND